MQEVKKVTTEVGTNEWQLVVFVLGEQSFAINVDKTREILRWPGCRAIPDAPVALIGITSVRGEVLPMVDLRVFLGIPPVTPLEQSKVIIAEFNEVKFIANGKMKFYVSTRAFLTEALKIKKNDFSIKKFERIAN